MANAAVLKTAGPRGPWGFESLALRVAALGLDGSALVAERSDAIRDIMGCENASELRPICAVR